MFDARVVRDLTVGRDQIVHRQGVDVALAQDAAVIGQLFAHHGEEVSGHQGRRVDVEALAEVAPLRGDAYGAVARVAGAVLLAAAAIMADVAIATASAPIAIALAKSAGVRSPPVTIRSVSRTR